VAEITQKDFKQLLDAQQQTTEMLRQSMMTAEEREAERIAAEARREARSAAAIKGHETRRLNAEKEGNAAQDETTAAIQANTDQQKNISDAERGNRAAADEKAAEAEADADKNRSLLGKIAGGINGLYENAKNTAKKAGKTGLAVLSGIAFGALLFAFGEFLQSDTFKNLTDYLIGPNGLLSRLASFDISFGEGVALLGTLLGGLALAFAAGPLNLLFKPLNAAVTGIKAGIGGLTSRLGSAGRQISGRPASGAAPAAGRAAGRGGRIGGALRGAGGAIGGLARGLAGGLAALANPATLIGLAAVVLAVNGIAAAVRIASPAFEPFGKLLESAGETIKTTFSGLGGFIKDIGATVEGIIGRVAESITNVLAKISEARSAGITARTEQIKQLSTIEPGQIEKTAKGIAMMKESLEGFGSKSFGETFTGLFGSGGPVQDILKLAKESEMLARAATALTAIAGSGVTYKQLMNEEARLARIEELEEDLASGGYTRSGGRARDEAELAKLQAQAPVRSTFMADPRVEAMITSAINKSNIAAQGVTVNNVSQIDNSDQSTNTSTTAGRPITDTKRAYSLGMGGPGTTTSRTY